jgi:hypothetical protein
VPHKHQCQNKVLGPNVRYLNFLNGLVFCNIDGVFKKINTAETRKDQIFILYRVAQKERMFFKQL